jgi:hypothetical protein
LEVGKLGGVVAKDVNEELEIVKTSFVEEGAQHFAF